MRIFLRKSKASKLLRILCFLSCPLCPLLSQISCKRSSFNFQELYLLGASLIAQLVKNLPVMQETLVRFLAWEDPLEKGWATHSSVLGLPLWFSW